MVVSRAELSGSDSLFMSVIGPDGTTEPSSGFTVDTTHSNPVTISDTGTDGFMVLQESNDWSGNFANNDLVLWTTGDAVATTLLFGAPVAGVGMQIQPNFFGSSFTASISAFNVFNTLLGSFTEGGTSNTDNDNSAIFIGVLDSTADVSYITVNIASPSGTDYAFNELTFGAAAGTSAPEPSSLALVLCGAGLFPRFLRKRRQG